MKCLKRFGLKKCLLLLLCVLLVLGACGCLVRVNVLKGSLLSQQAAGRWQGENEQSFAQVSCFVPETEKLTLPGIYGVRTALVNKLAEAGYDVEAESRSLFTDCWCATGSAQVQGENGKGTASVVAAGGNYFLFHPLSLVNGCYFGENDFNNDTVLLDEELAWLLFGGYDLQGLELTIGGKVFAVSGVYIHETDAASQKADNSGMCLYMSYDAWQALNADGENTAQGDITCYEVVLPETVSGAALKAVKECFTFENAELVCNTARFSAGSLMKLLRNLDTRAMQTNGIVYPYWENAARYLETKCALLLGAALLLLLLPAAVLFYCLVTAVKYGGNKFREDTLPRLRDNTEEAIRRAQRKQWEKQHPNDRALLKERAALAAAKASTTEEPGQETAGE